MKNIFDFIYLFKRYIYSLFVGLQIGKHGTKFRLDWSPVRMYGLRNIEVGDYFRARTCLRLEAIDSEYPYTYIGNEIHHTKLVF